jgi:hypothetical protein
MRTKLAEIRSERLEEICPMLTEIAVRKSDAAIARLRSLGDHGNSGATQFLEIASELPNCSNQFSNDETEGYCRQELLYCGQKPSRCRVLFARQLLRAYRSRYRPAHLDNS